MRAKMSKLAEELFKDKKFGRELMRQMHEDDVEIYVHGTREINDYTLVYSEKFGKYFKFKKI